MWSKCLTSRFRSFSCKSSSFFCKLSICISNFLKKCSSFGSQNESVLTFAGQNLMSNDSSTEISIRNFLGNTRCASQQFCYQSFYCSRDSTFVLIPLPFVWSPSPFSKLVEFPSLDFVRACFPKRSRFYFTNLPSFKKVSTFKNQGVSRFWDVKRATYSWHAKDAHLFYRRTPKYILLHRHPSGTRNPNKQFSGLVVRLPPKNFFTFLVAETSSRCCWNSCLRVKECFFSSTPWKVKFKSKTGKHAQKQNLKLRTSQHVQSMWEKLKLKWRKANGKNCPRPRISRKLFYFLTQDKVKFFATSFAKNS